MEYAGSYALYNYRLADPKLGLEYSNIRLIRAFEHGLDLTSSEAGFVLVHIDMVQNSGPLVAGVKSALDACDDGDREAFDAGLQKMVTAMTKVNKVMESKSSSLLIVANAWLTCHKQCGKRVNQTTMSPSEHSSSVLQAKACSPTA